MSKTTTAAHIAATCNAIKTRLIAQTRPHRRPRPLARGTLSKSASTLYAELLASNARVRFCSRVTLFTASTQLGGRGTSDQRFQSTKFRAPGAFCDSLPTPTSSAEHLDIHSTIARLSSPPLVRQQYRAASTPDRACNTRCSARSPLSNCPPL